MIDWPVSPSAQALHRDSMILDMTLPFVEVCGSLESHLRTLERMHHSGFTFVSVTVALDGYTIADTVKRIAAIRDVLRQHEDKYVLCGSISDIHEAKKSDRLGVGLHFQGTDPFARDLKMVQVYYDLGIRHALMAYNQKNWVGDGCHERTDCGLSRFGIALVKEMNRVGMLVDCSHTGYRTTMDVMEVSESPVIFSHANARALVDHERNIREDQIRAIAASGGVIGLTGVGIFIGNNEGTVDKLLDQVDYFAGLIGAEHLGIALDFVSDVPHFMEFVYSNPDIYPGRGYDKPVEFVAPDRLPEVTEGLLSRGYSEEQIRGILGGNWMRVAGQVWK